MSKRNMLLGLAAGKIGDLVFYRDGGEQRTRTRVVPKNPRSQAQMAQRVRIANVSAIYRLLKAVIQNSFVGRPSNQSGYNAFASTAIAISPFLTREIALNEACVPAPYIIARGTITPIAYQVVSNDTTSSLVLQVPNLAEGARTIGELSALLLQSYSQLQQGDILTFVGVAFYEAGEDVQVFGFRGFPVIESLKIDSTSTEPFSSSSLSIADGSLTLSISESSEYGCGAIVISRVDGSGSLQTSLAGLSLTESASAVYDNFRTDNALYEATESYGVGSDSILRE